MTRASSRTLYKSTTSILLAALTAFSAMAFTATKADAHRYRHHHGGAIAFGIAAAVITGIALSRHHRYHRRHYYYYGDYGYYRPRYYSYGYYHRPRYWSHYRHRGWGHRHYRHVGHRWHRRHW